MDPSFRPPPEELPRPKHYTPQEPIAFDIKEFYKSYFPNEPIEARSPTPWHFDIYYRKQYYLYAVVFGLVTGLFMSWKRINVDRARQKDWDRHHGDPLSYHDTFGPINPHYPYPKVTDHYKIAGQNDSKKHNPSDLVHTNEGHLH
ncbi:unnamed protein product [Didymodactylos carnosus]|uniref:Uncharacterized protein n=1 Tax=Didymodactylos carnosus TaxID=1234261 RepID=A0A813TNF3_9BILA|nr:unnamed protein product [Didymodactylos carnosus]CAF0811602.1 unnamed protein product [Didymodactylos carnosus]CAF3527310.1 unnamed protein product [Didymodactylos carnosus]CAF3597257.1 unnamed protein product [Didymodactylos carnosus]